MAEPPKIPPSEPSRDDLQDAVDGMYKQVGDQLADVVGRQVAGNAFQQASKPKPPSEWPEKSLGADGKSPHRWYRKFFPESWQLRPIPRGLLALAGVIAVWILDKIDAPLWLAIATLVVLLASAAAWSWIEQRGRQKWFWVSLGLYAAFVVVVVHVHLSPSSDWRRSDEAKQLASQMTSDVQKLEDEGRLIDLTDYHHAIKVYADWVEKCSVTLGRIDKSNEEI